MRCIGREAVCRKPHTSEPDRSIGASQAVRTKGGLALAGAKLTAMSPATWSNAARLVAAAVLAAALLGACAESNPAAEQAALAAGDPWLALIDAGDYAEARRTAAPLFRELESAEAWDAKVREYRDPLGALESRSLGTSTYFTNPLNAPSGTYVVLVFDSQWEGGAIHEVVNVQRQEDGRWLVAGYDVAQQ